MSQMLFSTSKSWPSSEKTPAVVTSSIIGSLDGDDGAQHFAPFHLVERVFHVLEADRLRHESVEVESALEVQVDEEWEVTAREAVAVPRRLQGTTAAEEVDHRDVGQRHVRGRDADLHDRSREVAGVERLLEHLGPADRLDADVGAVAVGELADALHRVVLRRVDRVRGAEVARPLELPS